MSNVVDETECPDCPAGIPPWVMTFADLMSLLMCFFVLLLSFSEMDVLKFKRLAGSMAQAFGVQAIVDVNQVPKGTSIIAQEFSPGKPDPTPLNVIMQHSSDQAKHTLDVECSEVYQEHSGDEDTDAGVKTRIIEKIKDLVNETENDAVKLAQALHDQIVQGAIEIETQGRKIVIRIKEKGSFASGTGELAPQFLPIMARIRDVLSSQVGSISVEGHTDNIPISTHRYRSNWELSTSRAVSVAHELMLGGLISQRRFSVQGFADIRPLVDNDTPANRSLNRRVEIVVRQGWDTDAKENLEVLKAEDEELYKSLNLELETKFNLSEDEIF